MTENKHWFKRTDHGSSLGLPFGKEEEPATKPPFSETCPICKRDNAMTNGVCHNTHVRDKDGPRPAPITVNLLTAGVPTLTGRVYSKALLEGMVEQFNKRTNLMYGTYASSATEYPDTADAGNATHRVERLHMEGNELLADIQLLERFNLELINKARFFTCGVGVVEAKTIIAHQDLSDPSAVSTDAPVREVLVVSDYTLTGVNCEV